MSKSETVRLSPGTLGALCAGVLVVSLALVSGLPWLLSSEPLRLGLPQVLAALALAGLAAGLLSWREGALGGALDACHESTAKLEGALKHQTGLAQGILGGMPMPYLLVDEQERAVRSNEACLQMLELSGKPEDYYGQTLAQIFYNDPTRKTAVGRSINGGEVFRNLEVQIKGHRGGVRHVLANVYPLYDSDKRCLGGLCLYLDMTALKEKEQIIVDKNQAVTSAADQAGELCRRLREASERLSASIGQTSSGAGTQKDRLSGVGTAMSQMGEAVVDVARSASEAARGTDDTRRQAEQGAHVVEEVTQAIRQVAERAQAMQERLAELGGQVAGIAQILGVINDIADQTNLLALNAAIEAARAGDAGRGFAVVADEVRKLAEKTMQATQQVAQAITGVQEGARRASEVMDGAAQAVVQSTGLADSAGATLREILRIAQGSADQVRGIAAASEEQSATAEEITRAVDDVASLADRVAGEMGQAAQAVESLAELADELTDIIGKMQSC